MARIRSIKPEFWTSEQIVECSSNARLLFIGMWNFCDDGGVHPDSPKRLKMEIFPGDGLSADDVQALVDELVLAKLVVRFESDGKSYLAVTGWHHQKIERASYRWPQPPSDRRPIVEQSSNGCRSFDDNSPPEWSGGEGMYKTPCIPPKKTKRKFKKPTVAEVEAYCLERRNGISGQEFVDAYERIGWLVGKNKTPMRDWKAAVRTWEQNRKQQTASRTKGYNVTAEDDAGWTP